MDEEGFNGAQLKSFSRLEKLTVGMSESQLCPFSWQALI